ncbi:cyclase family protein [Cutibacterium sp. V947]|uniref:cyclase family protein n=1 Tax=Cutibacterium sp. V947 TaxID=3446480 RepID=UPI003EE1414F
MVRLLGVEVAVIDLSQSVPAAENDPGFRGRENWLPEKGPEQLEKNYFNSPLVPEEVRLRGRESPWSISRDAFPDGRFLTNEWFTISTHFGTHVDAPFHYGSANGTQVADLPLEGLMGPAVVLRPRADDDRITAGAMAAAVCSHGDGLPRIALIETDPRHAPDEGPGYFTEHAGLTRGALQVLLDAGVEVIGTDGASLDRPSAVMIREFLATGDRSVMWPCHLAGREHPFQQVERLANLDQLPSGQPFTFLALPIKLNASGAVWCRAVALVSQGVLGTATP